VSEREDMAWEFAHTAKQQVGGDLDEPLLAFRMILIKEEVKELDEAIDLLLYEHMCGKGASVKTRAAFLKELCDVQYVLSGMLVAVGLDRNFDEAYSRVHASNMSKFPPVFKDGKVLKGENYKPPLLEDLV
jgi:predicted HAD superfamily Cof-like phosphohydrolase